MKHPSCFKAPLLALALGLPLSASASGCFSDYGNDCSRNVDLACFWGDGGGGSGGSTVVPACGDGELNDGEACDDGNTDDCDGCRGDCSAEETGCGDGFTCGDEQCDEGAANSNEGACTEACLLPSCGDHLLQTGEECDDGNPNAGDGCGDCKVECLQGNIGAPAANVSTYRDDSNLHCYVQVRNAGKSWSGARNLCQTWGGDLVAFATSQERASVTSSLADPASSELWTGGNDQTTADEYEWSNGEPWPASADWGPNQPSDTGGDNAEGCVALGVSSRLYDEPCGNLFGYVCEKVLTIPK